jgi:type IV fimbrial biogenesis protein FimT
MKASKGFTIIELLVVISVVVILIAIAVPSYITFIERNRLRGAAEMVYEQLMQARNLAIKRSKPITVEFSADGSAAWALGITDETECDPDAADSCTVDYDNDPDTDDDVTMVASSATFKNVVMPDPGLSDDNIVFDPLRGFSQAGADQVVTMNSASGNYEVRVIVTETGRVRLCSPGGSKNVSGIPDC